MKTEALVAGAGTAAGTLFVLDYVWYTKLIMNELSGVVKTISGQKYTRNAFHLLMYYLALTLAVATISLSLVDSSTDYESDNDKIIGAAIYGAFLGITLGVTYNALMLQQFNDYTYELAAKEVVWNVFKLAGASAAGMAVAHQV